MKALSRLLPRRSDAAVRAVYEAIVAAARHPYLYGSYGVPDTLDGRYDMIVLHAILVLDRLKTAGSGAVRFSQQLTDYLFADMDRSLREMGVGDLSVGKKVRVMAEVFYGRAKAYSAGLDADSRELLSRALDRNVFSGDVRDGDAERLAEYVFSAREALREISAEEIMAGRIRFREPGS